VKEEQFLCHCADLLDAKEEQFLCRRADLLDAKEEQFLHHHADLLLDAKEEQFLHCHAVLQEQLKDLLGPYQRMTRMGKTPTLPVVELTIHKTQSMHVQGSQSMLAEMMTPPIIVEA